MEFRFKICGRASGLHMLTVATLLKQSLQMIPCLHGAAAAVLHVGGGKEFESICKLRTYLAEQWQRRMYEVKFPRTL